MNSKQKPSTAFEAEQNYFNSMALQTAGTRGCSGCLIRAIVLHDVKTLRRLLSSDSAEFSDTYWIPIASLDCIVAESDTLPEFRTLFSQLVKKATKHCIHSMLAETLSPGRPDNIALSFVLMAMLNTTSEFNPLQILIDSHKFDLSEPLLFHLPLGGFMGMWTVSLVAVDPVGLALLIDSASDIDDVNSYPLLQTLVCIERSSSLNPNPLNMNIRMMELLQHLPTTRLIAFRANGALSFLYSYSKYRSYAIARLTVSDPDSYINPIQREKRLLSTLKVLCRMGLTMNVETFPDHYYKELSISFHEINPFNFSCSQYIRSTYLEILFEMFGMNFWNYDDETKEYYASEWLSNGWIFAQKNDWICLHFLVGHYLRELSTLDSYDAARIRILRQLLALGLFRELASEQFWSAPCGHCRLENQAALVPRRQCPRVAPFVDEFLRGPLSLLQLSRAEIRRLVGTKNFSSCMETLQKMGFLPPLLLEYVWRANEMLADAASQPQLFDTSRRQPQTSMIVKNKSFRICVLI